MTRKKIETYFSSNKIASFVAIVASVFLVVTAVHAATTISTYIQTDGTLSVTGTSTLMGVVGVGTTTPVSQLDLENYTVTQDGGTLTGGNPQFQMNGTLDSTQGATGHVIGAQWQWNTLGSNGVNESGLRINLEPGYTGNGLVRGIEINNLVQGTHSLGIADEHGNIGGTLAAQGGAADDSTIGDNIGAYAIANGSKNVNVAVYGRSFDQAPANAGYSVANIGVIGVASHNYLGPASTEIGGFFAAGGGGTWYNNLATSSTALLLDNEGEGVPILIGRVNGSNAFTVTNIGGITSTSTTNSTNFWQVFNSSGSPLVNLDTTNMRVGIGTTTPADNLIVTNPSSTATLGLISDGNSVGSGNVRFDLQNGDGNKYSLQYGGNGNALLKTQYNGASVQVLQSNGALNVGGNVGATTGTILQANGVVFVSTSTASNQIALSDTASGAGHYGFISNSAANTWNLGYGTSFSTLATPVLNWNTSGHVGIGTTSPATLLEVGGSTNNITLDGYLNCTGFTSNANGLVACTASDERLKQDIVPLDASGTLAALSTLKPVSFYWKPDTERGTTEQFGLIAQDVQRVFPNLVSTSSPTALTPDGTLTLNYDGLIAPLLVAVQELLKEVSGLAQSITTQVITAVTGNFDVGNFSDKLCVGSTCVTPAQFEAMVKAASTCTNATSTVAQ